MTYQHTSVMLDEVVDGLRPQGGGIFVDCTLGGGGHTLALLEGGAERVVGIDRDPAALDAARRRCKEYGDRLSLVRGSFGDLGEHLNAVGLEEVDGVLADLGVSSHQLDTPERGFSFRFEGPVDMRMDPDAATSAEHLVNTLPERELADIIFEYGEERRSRAVAKLLVAGRPWTDTKQLADAISARIGDRKKKIHPATKTFQALRIAVNDELGELKRLLPQAVRRLRPGGRLAIVTFHSLEDRITKRFLQRCSGRGVERDVYGHPLTPPTLQLLPSTPSSRDSTNPRARSARLRVAVRLPCQDA